MCLMALPLIIHVFFCWFSFLVISRVWVFEGEDDIKGITYKQAELKEDLHKLHDAHLFHHPCGEE